MEVVDAEAVGRFLVGLVLKPKNPRPQTVGEFKAALGAALKFHVPDDTPVDFIDTPMNRLKIRLPPQSMVEDAITRFNSGLPLSRYPMPTYMSDIMNENVTADQLFYARIGDYTTSECA